MQGNPIKANQACTCTWPCNVASPCTLHKKSVTDAGFVTCIVRLNCKFACMIDRTCRHKATFTKFSSQLAHSLKYVSKCRVLWELPLLVIADFCHVSFFLASSAALASSSSSIGSSTVRRYRCSNICTMRFTASRTPMVQPRVHCLPAVSKALEP